MLELTPLRKEDKITSFFGLSRLLASPSSSTSRGPSSASPFASPPTSSLASSAKRTPANSKGKEREQSNWSAGWSFRSFLRDHGWPDLVCLQEIRARPSDGDWIQALKDAPNVNRGTEQDGEKEPRYDAHLTLCANEKGQRRFGVVTYAKIHPELQVSASREVTWDSEGRVRILEFGGRDGDGWALVNVYALNGSQYTWMPPVGQPRPPRSITRYERKDIFNRLVADEVSALHARNFSVILIGDFNITPTSADCCPRLRTEPAPSASRAEFWNRLVPRMGVVDVWRKMNGPDARAYSWFAHNVPQGQDCARVDYALVDKELMERGAVRECVYLMGKEHRVWSDHAPIKLVLNKPALEWGATERREAEEKDEMASAAQSHTNDDSDTESDSPRLERTPL